MAQVKVKWPKAIKIGSLDFDLCFEEEVEVDGDTCWGAINTYNQKIEIWSEASLQRQKETIIHETMHGIWGLFILSPKATEEEVCTKMAQGLMMVLRDNPKLAKILTEKE